MAKCWNCGVEIDDPVRVCPLCKCILERDDTKEPDRSEALYPFLDAERVIKKMQRALNIYLFAAIACELILFVINFQVHGAWGWLLLVGVLLVYGYITLKVSIQMPTSYRLKIFLQTLLGWGVLFVIDLVSGFHGWSLNYIIPAACLLSDVAVVILMLVNSRDWQSYIPMQLFVIAFAIAPFVLYHYHLVTNLVVALVAIVAAVLVFIGTMIVGGRRARTELYRRFHV